MKKYNCSDPEENQLPHWMAQNRTVPADTKVQTSEDAEHYENAFIQVPVQKKDMFQPFVYQRDPFYPEFCIMKHK